MGNKSMMKFSDTLISITLAVNADLREKATMPKVSFENLSSRNVSFFILILVFT